MRLRAAILALILGIPSVSGAATLRGVVLANELHGAPISNVEVSAVAGANPATTDAHGIFTLQFPNKQPGDRVQVIVRKRYMVVVNDVQLKLALPLDADAEPLTILLCREGDREEMARRFYRLKSFGAIDETYRRRLRELEETSRATHDALNRLARERDRAKASAETAAAMLARLEPGAATLLHEQAMSLFVAGRPEDALRLLDDEKLRRSVEDAHQQVTAAVQTWLLKAQVQTSLFQFDEAAKTYEAVMTAAPTSFQAHWAAGVFYADLDRLQQARTAYSRSLEIAELDDDAFAFATALNSLGLLNRKQNRFVEARNALEDATKIYRTLAQKKPEYRFYVAFALHSVAALYDRENRKADARRCLEEALAILRDLVREDADSHLASLAAALRAIAHLELNEGRFPQARAALAEALVILRARGRSAGIDEELARTLLILAGADSEENRLAEARRGYEEALLLYRDLARRNPEAHLPDVGDTLNGMGILFHLMGRDDEAYDAHQGALTIYRHRAEKHPEAYLPQVATILNNVAALLSDTDRVDDAGTKYDESIAIYRELNERTPRMYAREMAETLANRANIYAAQGKPKEARRANDEALTICRDLARQSPDAQDICVGGVLLNAGNLSVAQDRPRDARREYEEALAVFRRLSQRSPDAYREPLSKVLRNLASLDSREERMAEAQRAYEEVLRIHRDLARRNPGAFLPEVARDLNNLGALHGSQKQWKEARRFFEEALPIARAAAKSDRSPLATTLMHLADLNRHENRPEDAHRFFEEARGVFTMLVARGSRRHEDDLDALEWRMRLFRVSSVMRRYWLAPLLPAAVLAGLLLWRRSRRRSAAAGASSGRGM